MKRTLVIVGCLLCAMAGLLMCQKGHAQQAAEDPKIAAYRQLLLEANDRLASALGQAQALQVENSQLKARLPKEEKKD